MSRFLNKQVLIVPSTRYGGDVYKFTKKESTRFACLSYKKLGKTRTVPVNGGRIRPTSVKHPDDGHYPDCRPIREAGVDATDMMRAMAADVKKSGKRPRDTYLETLASIRKK